VVCERSAWPSRTWIVLKSAYACRCAARDGRRKGAGNEPGRLVTYDSSGQTRGNDSFLGWPLTFRVSYGGNARFAACRRGLGFWFVLHGSAPSVNGAIGPGWHQLEGQILWRKIGVRWTINKPRISFVDTVLVNSRGWRAVETSLLPLHFFPMFSCYTRIPCRPTDVAPRCRVTPSLSGDGPAILLFIANRSPDHRCRCNPASRPDLSTPQQRRRLRGSGH